MLRNSVFHMCQWVSTRPGSTIMPWPSMTEAPGALRFWPTATMAPLRDMHVAIGDVAGLIHRHDVGVADDEGAARRQCPACRSTRRADPRGRTPPGGDERGAVAQQMTAAHQFHVVLPAANALYAQAYTAQHAKAQMPLAYRTHGTREVGKLP